MSTLAELKNKQAFAARRYNNALTELYASWVDLGALDGAIANTRVGGSPVGTFGSNLDEHRASLHAHPMVSEPDLSPLSERIVAARDAYLKTFTG